MLRLVGKPVQTAAFIKTIADYIKSIDPYHLVRSRKGLARHSRMLNL